MSNSGERLLTLEEVGQRMNRCARVVKQLLTFHPDIRPIKVGRSKMLTEEDYLLLIEALRAPAVPSVRIHQTGTRTIAPSQRDECAREKVLRLTQRPHRKGG